MKTPLLESERAKLDFLTTKLSGYIGLSPEIIKSKSRRREIVDCRKIIIMTFFDNKRKTTTLHSIGDYFSIDHATVLHSIKTGNNLFDSDTDFREKVRWLRQKYHDEYAIVDMKGENTPFYDTSKVTDELVLKAYFGK